MHRAALKRIDAMAEREIARGMIPGAVLLVQHRGEVVHRGAFGSLDPQRGAAMREDALFRIYSMTKPVASVALMMLVEEGLLRLADPVAQHLPEFADLELGVVQRDRSGRETIARRKLESTVPNGAGAPLVHDLLRHTAGLTYGSFGTSLVKSAYLEAGVESGEHDNTEFAHRLARLPLAHAPGTVWEYSRATDLVGSLIERLTGATLGSFLRQRIFEPLQMHDTGFDVDAANLDRIAEPFALDPIDGQPIRLFDPRRRAVFESAGGGLISSAADYLRFADMLRRGGTSADGVRLLARKTVALMTCDHLGPELIRESRLPGVNNGYLPGAGYGFGLGFAVRLAGGEAPVAGSPGDHHWSGIGGTYFWIDPAEDLVGIWMMQAPERRDRYWDLFTNLVYAAL